MKTRTKLNVVMFVALALSLMLLAVVPAVGGGVVAEATTSKIVTPLDFTEGSADITTYATEVNGVQWNNENKTLTLNNVEIDCSAVTDCMYAVQLPVGSTIVLAKDSVNTITAGKTTDKSIGILVGSFAKPGDLEITSSQGTLNVYSQPIQATDVGTMTTAVQASIVNVGDGVDYPYVNLVAGEHVHRSYGACCPVTVKTGELYMTGSVGATSNYMVTPNKSSVTTKATVVTSTTYKAESGAMTAGIFSSITTKTVKVIKGSLPGIVVPVTAIEGVPTQGIATVELRISAVVKPFEATHKDIIWTVIDQGTTGVEYKNGALLAKTAGTATIRGTIKRGLSSTQDYSQDFQITFVLPFIPVETITDVPAHLEIGSSVTLKGVVYPANATNKTIAWTLVSDGGTGAVFTDNTLTATSAGTIRVLATVNGGKTKETAFTKVFDIVATPKFVPVTSITTDVNFLEVGLTLPLTASIQPENATHKDIVWTIVDDGGTGATLTGNVLFSEKIGTVTVRATIVDGAAKGDFTQDFEILCNTVGIPVDSIRLNKYTLEMYEDTTESLIATISPLDASNQTVIWTSSDITIATVDENGVITPVSLGTVTITATSWDGAKIASCEVTIVQAPLRTERIILIVSIVCVLLVAIATAIACIIIKARRNKRYVMDDEE